MSTTLLPVTNAENDTINQVDENSNPVYESLRLQFIITSPRYLERDICKTIVLFLKSSLCSDPVVGVSDDGTEFIMTNNNSDSAFKKLKRIYMLQDEFIQKCVRKMQVNLKQVHDGLPNTEEYAEHKLKITRDIVMLDELVEFYIKHENCMKVIEQLKMLI